ncbi:shikimate kinase [Listeria booriae]|uniref:shikimate kinase n=1 Tax=Listeria booriae TaxID=1552123 RepID=UPI00162AF66B|nr:shikimate kinase [Listeria booriae]MBC2325377.1 shikimate kinase [Listeria booriae]
MDQIVLTGFMGAGKSTVGKILADNLALPFIDIDSEIQREQGMLITDIFAQLGESKFRELEHQTLLQALQKNAVIATGGGIILSETNQSALKNANHVIYLKTNPQTFLTRLSGDTSRPLIQEKSPQEIQAIFDSRTHLYENTAHLIVETDNLTPDQIVDKIKNHFQLGKGQS